MISSYACMLSKLLMFDDISSYIVKLFLYIRIQIEMVQTAGLLPHEQDKAKGRITKLERTLVFIPIAFVVLRMWAVVQYFYSIYLQHIEVGDHCIPTVPHKQIHVTLGILQVNEHKKIITGIYSLSDLCTVLCMQAIGGGGQGWMNGILYLILSAKIRNRIALALKNCCRNCYCYRKIKNWTTQQEPSCTGTHFSSSHEPIETDHLIQNWEIIK